MSSNRMNYVQLLGLNPLKEKNYTKEQIDKRIESRKTKWKNDSANKQNGTDQRFKAEKLYESVPEIERVMADPYLRAKEFSDGLTILKGKVGKLRQDCVILSDGTYVVLPGVIENYVKKLHWDDVKKAEVLKLAEIREGEPPKAVSGKVESAFKALRTVDAYTPAEVLNAIIGHDKLEIRLDPLSEGSSLSQIRSAFEVCDNRVNTIRSELMPDQDSYIQCLRTVKLVLEPDSELNDLILYGKCQKAAVPVMETIEEEYIGQQLNRGYIDELLNVHIMKNVDRDMAVKILQGFCYKKRISANFSAVDSSMTRCPECGKLVHMDPNTLFCPSCGNEFKASCPSCGTIQMSSNKRCIKCGFDFVEGKKKAQQYDMMFRMDLKGGKISKAQTDLVKLREISPKYSELATMELALSKAVSTFNSLKKSIQDSYSNKKYYMTKGLCEDFVAQYPEILKEDPEIKLKYDECVKNVTAANVCCQKAKISDTQERQMGFYVDAVENCPDYPEALTVLKEHPPQGPSDAVGIQTNNNFTIKFKPSPDSGVTYCIYRYRNSLQNVTLDSHPMAEIPSTAYVDRSLDPGVEYYYSVYAKRWGVLSREGLHFGPIMVLADVETAEIIPIDGGLRIVYEKPMGCSRVRIWRSETKDSEGISTELHTDGATVYDDIGLKGGKNYYYLFVTEYKTHGNVERSGGAVFTGTTVNYPSPVKDLQIKWNASDGTYTARWGSSEDVRLYSCDKPLAIPGHMMKMEDVQTWLKPIEPLQCYSDGIRFALSDGSVQHIYPIIPCGNMAIKGNPLMIANVNPFRDIEKRVINGECIITMVWPQDAVEAKLVITNDRVGGLEDTDAEIKTVRREVYNETRQIRIDMGSSEKKCINIFAIYKFNNEPVASRGIVIDAYTADCAKVRYTVKPEKNGMKIQLSAGPGFSEIPPIIAVQTSKGIPLRKNDGEVIWRSDGPVRMDTPIDAQCRKPQVENMRLFFADEKDYNRFRFIHPLYGRH